MKIIQVNEKDLKSVTEFLLERKFIFHPVIAPDGIMDFSQYHDKNYVLILDRNLLTKMIEFFKKGILNDKYIRKVIGSIMFWAHFNNVSLNSGLALNEYASHKQDNSSTSIENNIFLKAMNYYNPKIWLALALDRIETIEPIPNIPNKEYNFEVVNDHYLMHMSEMFCITRLYFDRTLSPLDKVVEFFNWNLHNLLICQYTIVFSLLIFSDNSKVFKKADPFDFEKLLKICNNQSWDITYLSDWSTLYWKDKDESTIYLFATMDKELKKVFINTHDEDSNIFSEYFCKKDSLILEAAFENLKKNRKTTKINSKIIKKFYDSEYKLLESFINKK